MKTVVNNTSPVVEQKPRNFYLESVLLLGFAFLVLYSGIPAIKRIQGMLTGNPVLNIDVPDKININVNQAK